LTWVGVVEPEGALVAIFTTLVAGLAGVAPALTIVVVDVVAAGDAFTFGLPDEVVTLVGLTELIVVLVLEIVVEPLPEPNEPPPVLDAKDITGEELLLVDIVEVMELEKVGEVDGIVTTGVTLVVVDWGEMAAQGGPPEHPVITN
jgi:hypothetical protein